MKEFLEALEPYIPQIATAAGSLILAVLSFLYTKISHKNSQQRLDDLEKSDLKGLYVRCPYCGSKISLCECEIDKEVQSEKENVEKSV